MNRLQPHAYGDDLAPKEPHGHLRLQLPGASPVKDINQSLLIRGSAEEALDLLPDGSVQTAVTSR